MSFIVDASVAAKWYVDELHSEQALLVLDTGADLLAPDLLLAEVGNVLWRRVQASEIPAAQAVSAIERLPHAFADLLPLHTLHERALGLAIELAHPMYDCFYLAASEQMDAPLVTADSRLLHKLSARRWKKLLRPLDSFSGGT